MTGLSNTYFKLYNSILMDVKFMGLSRDAMAIWTLCAVWCSANLTDGRIPEQVVNHMCLLYPPLELSTGSVANAKAIASDLLDHGLWEEADSGYRMHDWADYQNTREEVEHIYEVRREAGSKGGRAKKANSVQSALTRNDRELSTGSVANAKAIAVAKSKQNVANGKQTCSKTYPDTDTDTDTPTSSLRSSVGGPGGGADSEHPLVPAPADDAAAVASAAPPTDNQLEVRGGGTPTRGSRQYTDEFEKFWKTYPRKVGKAEAAKAFTKLLKGGQVDADQLTAAAQAHAQAWQQSGTSQEFIPHASTWLNKGRWSDEPEVLNRTGDGRPTAGLSDDQWQQAWERAQILDADDDTQPPSPGWP